MLVLLLSLVLKTFIVPVTLDDSSFASKTDGRIAWEKRITDKGDALILSEDVKQCSGFTTSEASLTPNYIRGRVKSVTIRMYADIQHTDVAKIVISRRTEPETMVKYKTIYISGRKRGPFTISLNEIQEGELSLTFSITAPCDSSSSSIWMIGRRTLRMQ